jgi:GTP-binding protein EngB required for normal cell division
MLKDIYPIYFLVLFTTIASYGLDFATYEQLANVLLDESKSKEQQLSSVFDTIGGNHQLLLELKTIIEKEKDTLTLSDLRGILLAIQKKYPTSKLNEKSKAQVVTLFSELVTGKKLLKNVIVIGRSGAGKSTFLATMLDPLDDELHKNISSESLFSHTQHAQSYYGVFESFKGDLYTACFIDTPGLSEVKSKDAEVKARSDKEIIQSVVGYLKGRNIDQVVQIFPLSTERVSLEDTNAFKLFKKRLEEEVVYSGPIWLVVPKVDKFRHTLEATKNELLENLGGFNISQADYKKTYFTGTIFSESFKEGNKIIALSAATYVLHYRNLLLSNIFSARVFEGLVMTDEAKVNIDPQFRKSIEAMMPEAPQ